MAAETGYQMSTSSVEHLLIVIIFGIFHIVTRDVHVPYNYDHRCVVYTAPHAAPLSSSVSPTAPPRGRDALMRWLIALLCFIEEKYDGGEDAKMNAKMNAEMNEMNEMNAVLLEPGGKDAKMNGEKNEMNTVLLDPGGEEAKMNAEMNEINAVLLDPGGED